LIRQAGNADEDEQRLGILRQIAAIPGLDAASRSDAEKLAAFVDRWLHDKSLWRWFDREVRQNVDYDFGIARESAFYPLTHLYRGRMLFWVTNEYGNIIGYHDERRRFLDKAVQEFSAAQATFPDNRIVAMYLGRPLEWPRPEGTAVNAPQWAVMQHEGLERLQELVHWWIDHRLQPNGEYGGAWDDDCEMWRSWVPVMIAFADPKITQAQAFFSDALLRQDYMRDGYTSRTYDVEHTAEPTSDTILPMMHLAADDPVWERRARRLAELMETVWTGVNERGQLQFKSTYFNAQKADPNPERACDTPYCVVSVLPALLLWQRTADPQLTQLFSRWMDTWVEAARRDEAGKPPGVIPAAIHWPDGAVKGPGPEWWDPRHHGEPRLYEWPAAVAHLCDALLLTWHMTGQEKYLEPLRSMARLRQEWLNGGRKSGPPGSAAWCAARMDWLGGTLAKYQLLSGDRQFTNLLERNYSVLDSADSDPVHAGTAGELDKAVAGLRVNFPSYTSEVRFTDRVFAFARLYDNDMLFPDAVPANARRAQPAVLYNTATGDCGQFSVFPLNAVRWLTPPREIAALVTAASRRHLAAELFHFGQQERKMSAELYLLAPGEYTVELLSATDGRVLPGPTRLTRNGPRSQIAFTLPPQQLCRLRVTAQ
jgi:hypothetical protein